MSATALALDVPQRIPVSATPQTRPRTVDPRLDTVQLLAILRREGYVTNADCQWAVARAKQVGVPAGQVLLSWAKVNRLQLWEAQCELWRIPWVDVRAYPPDPALASAASLETCLANGWVPHHVEGDRLIVATSVNPTSVSEADAMAAVASVAPHIRDVAWIGCSDLDLDHMLLTACRDNVIWDASERLLADHPDETAATGPAPWSYPVFLLIIAVTLTAAVLRPLGTLAAMSVVLSAAFLFGSGFKAFALFAGGRALRLQEIATIEALLAADTTMTGAMQRRQRPARRRKLRQSAPRRVPDDELPVYTILVPAYREESVMAKLIENIEALDYPREKLDVIVLLEEDDEATLAAAKRAKPPGYVRLFVTPHGIPKTKPRACNAGLRFARGEYLVIYDAEDRPHPAQLRDVLSVFEVSDPGTVVVQARLNYFNAASNMLTRMFALEYAAWFDYMLPGLSALGLPIPLGGTSNHFITAALRDLGG